MAESKESNVKALPEGVAARIHEKIEKLRSERVRNGKAVARTAPPQGIPVWAFVQAFLWDAWVYNGQCGVATTLSTMGEMTECTLSMQSTLSGSQPYASTTLNPTPANNVVTIVATGSPADLPLAGSFVNSTITGTTIQGTIPGSFTYTTQCYVYDVNLSPS